MKLANLFLITALVGVLGAIGCSDDTEGPGGAGGNGGSAGSGGTEPCTGGLCEVADVKIDCEAAIVTCNADAELNLTPAQCDAFATEFYCNTGAGGAGGASGIPGCNESLCATDAERRALCEEFVPACIEFCEGSAEACGEDECLGFALVFICNEQDV